MNKRDRVKAAVQHQNTDIVPYNVELTSGELEQVVRLIGIKPDQFWDWAGNHIEKASYNLGGRQIQLGFFQDEFGVVWNRTIDKDIGVVTVNKYPEPDITLYQFPEPDIAAVRMATEKAMSPPGIRIPIDPV